MISVNIATLPANMFLPAMYRVGWQTNKLEWVQENRLASSAILH